MVLRGEIMVFFFSFLRGGQWEVMVVDNGAEHIWRKGYAMDDYLQVTQTN